MQRIEINVVTGQQTTVTLTPQEEAAALSATAAENAAIALAIDPNTLEANCQAFLNGGGSIVDIRKAFKAKVISDLAFRLGVAPGALTPAQINTERNRLAAIYKAL